MITFEGHKSKVEAYPSGKQWTASIKVHVKTSSTLRTDYVLLAAGVSEQEADQLIKEALSTSQDQDEYDNGHSKGFAQFKYGFDCPFVLMNNPSRIVRYHLGFDGKKTSIQTDPVPSEELDYAQGYIDGLYSE